VTLPYGFVKAKISSAPEWLASPVGDAISSSFIASVLTLGMMVAAPTPRARPRRIGRLRRRGQIGCSWYVDETYIKVHGRRRYLYRAVDRDGLVVDVMLGEHRDLRLVKHGAGQLFAAPADAALHRRSRRTSSDAG
jgi:hypothetical protein